MQIMSRDTHLGYGITVGQVQDARDAAGQAGDVDMVILCDECLEHDIASLLKFAEVMVYSEGNRRY